GRDGIGWASKATGCAPEASLVSFLFASTWGTTRHQHQRASRRAAEPFPRAACWRDPSEARYRVRSASRTCCSGSAERELASLWHGWSATAPDVQEERHRSEHQEHQEEDLRDGGREPCQGAKAQECRNEGDDQEDECVAKHEISFRVVEASHWRPPLGGTLIGKHRAIVLASCRGARTCRPR